MSKSAQSITSIGTPDGHNIWLRGLVHTWTNIEFVQDMLAQLLSIKAIRWELQIINGTDVEFVQQAVAQLPSIEAIERELQGINGGDA